MLAGHEEPQDLGAAGAEVVAPGVGCVPTGERPGLSDDRDRLRTAQPVYFDGYWYRGPIYYRWNGGERMFWLNGGWRRQ